MATKNFKNGCYHLTFGRQSKTLQKVSEKTASIAKNIS